MDFKKADSVATTRATRALTRSRARGNAAAGAGAAATTTRGRSKSRRVKAMKAVAKGRASKTPVATAATAAPAAPAAAGAGAGTGIAAGAAAAELAALVAATPVSELKYLPLFVYWTDITGRTTHVKMCQLYSDLKSASNTDLTREELEDAVMADKYYCGKNVSETYVEEQLDEAVNPMLFVISNTKITYRPRGDNSIPKSLGFIIARPEDKGVYLDIICTANRFGKLMLDFFHNFVFEHHKYEFVKLSSLANVLTLYPRFGYEFRKSCAGAPLTVLSKELATRDFSKKPPPLNTRESYKDKEYMDFMYDTLYLAHDLGVRDAENCKNRSVVLTRAQYGSEKHDCAQDGFTMLKCRPRASKSGKAGAVVKARRSRKNH